MKTSARHGLRIAGHRVTDHPLVPARATSPSADTRAHPGPHEPRSLPVETAPRSLPVETAVDLMVTGSHGHCPVATFRGAQR